MIELTREQTKEIQFEQHIKGVCDIIKDSSSRLSRITDEHENLVLIIRRDETFSCGVFDDEQDFIATHAYTGIVV